MPKTLRDFRIEKGMTLEEVADALDCAVSGPGAWETGRYGPSPRKIPRLAKVYGVSTELVRLAVEESKRRSRRTAAAK